MLRSLFPAIAAIGMIACQQNGGGEGGPVPASPANTSASSNSMPMPVPGANTSQPAVTAAGLNPPHGEPGHVCEIPVGQPLDGSGSTTPNEVTIDPATLNGGTTMIDPSMSQPATAGVTAAGMNPPHGEPGHVCEIPVGQPLP